MFCRLCGKEIPDDSDFCPRCGQNLKIQSDEKESNKKSVVPARIIALSGTLLFAIAIIVVAFVLLRNREDNTSSDSSVVEQTTIEKTSELEKKSSKDEQPKEEGKESVKEEEANASEDVPPVTLNQAETALKSIDKSLSGFLWAELFENERQAFQNAGDSMDISLSDSEKIRAAVLACEKDGKISNTFANKDGKVVIDKTAGTGPDGRGYQGDSVDPKQVNENCIDLFGTEANLDKLQTSEQNGFYDAVKYVDDTETYAIILDAEVDTEHDQESHEYRITEDGDGFIGEVDMFFGYWGELQQDPGYSNYTVTYKLEPNSRSKYGVSVSSIRIKKISDSSSENNQDPNQNVSSDVTQYKEPFYGVWYAASKDLSEAKRVADKTNGHIFVSSDWSNLNKEKWYVVTAAICEYEDKAKAVLAAVTGEYPDAYIKFTGDYIGD